MMTNSDSTYGGYKCIDMPVTYYGAGTALSNLTWYWETQNFTISNLTTYFNPLDTFVAQDLNLTSLIDSTICPS